MPPRPADPSPPPRADVLEPVLARALELRDEGAPDWLEEACKGHPELLASVREAARRTELLPEYFARAADADPMLGRTIDGRFRLAKRIGAGAMGVVYLAEDLELVRPVAAKILRHGLVDPEESGQRFSREAEAMASVQHPSVVTVHDRGRTAEGDPYMVMEWVDGTPLDVVVDEARRKADAARVEDASWLRRAFDIDPRGESSYLRTAVRWTLELAEGLETVHRAGVLHRDIKPSNVIVRKDGRPVLLDFGIALLDGDSTLTRGVTSVGTPSYMPPEALVRGRHRSPASDVYSLTATLYHLLTLRPPFEGSPSEVLAAIATREPAPAARLRPGLPRDLAAILDKGMHRRPRARYASAAALAADLAAFLAFRPVAARPVGPLARASRSLRRSKAARGAALALAAVLLAGAAVELDAARSEAARERWFERARRLPPNFTVVGPTNRVYRHEADRARLAALLDSLARTGVEPLRAHLLRASFRLDHGDPAGAASDMAAVARAAPSEYSRALAARYAAVGPAARGAGAVDLAGLPPAATAEDHYLDAYHRLRAGDEAGALERLSAPEVRAIPHAEELRLAFTPFAGLDTEGRNARARGALADALRLEARLGGRTAATAHVAGRMLDVLGRFEDALPVLEEGIELAGRAHTIRINAGFAALGLGRLDEAERHFEVAIDLRPNDRKPLQNLVWVLVAGERFDEALRRIADAPLDATPDLERWRLLARSSVETHRALAERRKGELAASDASVERAVADLLAAEALGEVRFGADHAILAGLVDGDEDAVCIGLAELLLEDPHHAWRLRSLVESMPPDPGPEAAAAIRRVLAALAARPLGG